MDITSLTGVASSDFMEMAEQKTRLAEFSGEDFDSVFNAAVSMLKETNDLQNDAQSAKMQFALGEADNPHDMQIAESKALVALQYTTAVRDKMLEAYKEIMNMQI